MSERFASWEDAGITPDFDRIEFDTTCPRCSDGRTKSAEECLSVNTDKRSWFCHHCSWSGYIGVRGKKQHEVPEITFKQPLNANAAAWLEHRGIPLEIAHLH